MGKHCVPLRLHCECYIRITVRSGFLRHLWRSPLQRFLARVYHACFIQQNKEKIDRWKFVWCDYIRSVSWQVERSDLFGCIKNRLWTISKLPNSSVFRQVCAAFYWYTSNEGLWFWKWRMMSCWRGVEAFRQCGQLYFLAKTIKEGYNRMGSISTPQKSSPPMFLSTMMDSIIWKKSQIRICPC